MSTRQISTLILVASLALLGCDQKNPGVNSPSTESQEIAGRISPNGVIETKIFPGLSVSTAHGTTARATVGEDYVLVGGGCKVDWVQQNGGAMLTESYPSEDNLRAWVCSSKDHVYPQAHNLRPYAIGMKIKGVPQSTLQGYIKRKREPGTSGSYSLKQVDLPNPADNILLSGGAKAKYGTSQGAVLTYSHPVLNEYGEPTGWIGASQGIYYGGVQTTTDTYIMYMPKRIGGYVFQTIAHNDVFAVSGNTAELISTVVDENLLITGVGGFGKGASKGRFLFAMYPESNYGRDYAQTGSKDHVYTDGGETNVAWVGVKQK